MEGREGAHEGDLILVRIGALPSRTFRVPRISPPSCTDTLMTQPSPGLSTYNIRPIQPSRTRRRETGRPRARPQDAA